MQGEEGYPIVPSPTHGIELSGIPEADRPLTSALVQMIGVTIQRDQLLQQDALPYVEHRIPFFSSMADGTMSAEILARIFQAHVQDETKYNPAVFHSDRFFENVAIFPSVKGRLDPHKGEKGITIVNTARGQSMFDGFVLPSGVQTIHFVEGKPIEATRYEGGKRPLTEAEKEQLLLLINHAKAKVEDYTRFEQTGQRDYELYETGQVVRMKLPPGASKGKEIETYLEQIREYNKRRQKASTTSSRVGLVQFIKRLPGIRKS